VLPGESDRRRSFASAPRSARLLPPLSFGATLPVLCFLGLLMVAGCGSSGKDKLYPVSGKVTLGGTVLTAGQVTFHPDLSKGNNAKGVPTGALGADGTYSLTTDGKAGAPVGAYKVTVITNFPGASGTPVPINPKYANPNASGLNREVVPNSASAAYDLQVTK
jgi:hypothetical protein